MYYIWGYMRDYISHYQKLAGTTSYQKIYKGLSNRATSLLIHLRYIFLRSNLNTNYMYYCPAKNPVGSACS